MRRAHIPKGDGSTRRLGIPSLEDKIVQQAARMVNATALEEAERLNREVVRRHREGNFDAAVTLATRALAILEKALGPEHPDVAALLNNLAQMERVALTLAANGGNQAQTAAVLGIGASTLYRNLRRYRSAARKG